MKKMLSCFSVAALAAGVLFSAPGARAAAAGTPGAYAPQYENQPWAVPPSGWQAAQQRGFRDGVRGAYKDAQNHRQPNVNNRDEYRHPDVPRGERRAYREGFQRGYWTGVRHLMGYYSGPNPYAEAPPQQQGYYPNEPWAVPPSNFQAVEQRGFRDGVRGAYKDAQNHRQPNVNNRDEYRNPDVPRREWRAYREGFRRGYQVGVDHLMSYYHRR